MKILDTKIPEVKIIEPDVFGDHRGWFMETWSLPKYEALHFNSMQDTVVYSNIICRSISFSCNQTTYISHSFSGNCQIFCIHILNSHTRIVTGSNKTSCSG